MTEHTYLRYECADAFGLTVAGASSKAPPSSNNCLAAAAVVVKGTGGGSSTDGEGNNLALLLTTTGSQVTGFHVRSGEPVLKVGHRERLSGGVGTGRALNSTEVVCLAVSHRNHHRDNRSSSSSSSSNNSSSSSVKIATGWIDGAVRIFDVYDSDLQRKSSGALGTAHSLLSDVDDDDFCRREPLTLRGHGTSPVRTVAFDGAATTSAAAAGGARLASGGSDGVVILWDVVAETGLFRFTGHRGAITDVSFVALDDSKFDGLITSSLDGLVKIWDLDQQCCVQTLAGQDKVWASAARPLAASSSDSPPRWRLLTGGQDGQVRVWSVHSPVRNGAHPAAANGADKEQPAGRTGGSAATRKGAPDDVCTYMGTLVPPPNVSTSSERISCVHYHPATGRFVGVVHANAKHVHVYIVRGTEESHRKRQRRLRRRQEKKKKKAVADIDAEEKSLRGGKKRGLLDDPESSDDEEKNEAATAQDEIMDPELLKASDEFEYLTTVRCGHKVRGFTFLPGKVRGEVTRLVCALSTNALETHAVIRKKEKDTKAVVIVTAEKINTLDMVGHPTGIRSVALSSDDRLACTVSKNVTKIWNVAGRSCIQSLSLDKNKSAGYGLCAVFLPGNTHVAVGTREGHLFLLDTAAGEVVYCEEKAHKGAIWSLDLRRRPAAEDESAATQLVTGSADRTVKFWTIESQDEDEESLQPARPMAVHTRTLQMTDDVIAVRYSSGPSVKRMLFVSTLDCTIKVFFEDSLKLFLSLYGHKLPALAVDGSDDDVLLASSGADKAIKIWGLDFGDTHRTLHGHEESVTDLKFVRRTHNFFTASKDGSVRYWDGDRFQQILHLPGHCAEVQCLAVSRTGAFVLSGGMDRQVRVWERTKDIVFLEEERERELEQMFDKVHEREEGGTASILDRKRGEGEDNDDDEALMNDDEPQSEAAVKRSVLSVASGDRIMEALERADQETKDIALSRKSHGTEKTRPANPLLLGLPPAQYVLWVLRTIKSAELEQSLIILPLKHIERLMYYIIMLLKSGRGIELCSRVAVFLVKAHQNQIVVTRSMAPPLRELRRLVRMRLAETRDVIGYDLAAMKMISRVANERRQSFLDSDKSRPLDIWEGLGLGSDLAAALEGRPTKR